MNDCLICDKHKNPHNFFGEIIAKDGGLILTHFPQMDSEKATKGHLLIEPERHVRDFTELNDEEANALGGLIKRGASAIKSVLCAEHVYMFRINDKVAHFHIHLVPRYQGTPKEYWGLKIMEWPDRSTIKIEEIRLLAANLKKNMLP